MLSILCVRLTIKVKVGIPESFKVGWYASQKTGSSHLNRPTSTKGMGCILVGARSFHRLRRFYGKNKASKLPYIPTSLSTLGITLGMGYGCAHA